MTLINLGGGDFNSWILSWNKYDAWFGC